MKIGELARAAGIQPSAIRYYEERGLLRKPARRSGKRVFGADALAELRFIAGAQRAGLSLDEIHALTRAVASPAGGRWRDIVQGKLEELRRAEVEIRAARRRLENTLACACAGQLSRCELANDLG